MSDTIPESTPNFKHCPRCDQDKPATPEFFYRRGNSLRKVCIACETPNRKPPKEKIPEGMKRCTGDCQQLLPATLEFFHKKRNGLFAICKACNNAKGKNYYYSHTEDKKQYARENKERIKKRMRQYNQDNKDEIAQRHRQAYIANKEQRSAKAKVYRSQHKEEIREHKSAYYKTDQGRMIARAGRHRHEARKKSVPGMLTPEQIQTKLKAQKYRCYYATCGHAKFEKVKGQYVYHLEHTIPVSRTELAPRHDPNFIVLACPACNLSKGNKAPWEWNEGGRLF